MPQDILGNIHIHPNVVLNTVTRHPWKLTGYSHLRREKSVTNTACFRRQWPPTAHLLRRAEIEAIPS
jgi:hypothetical protein